MFKSIFAVPLPLVIAFCTLAQSPSREPAREPIFQVPPGFTVEKVAGVPLVRYPLFAALDNEGRLFVAEGTGTNLPGTEVAKKKLGKIVLLEDTNGDGKFDTSKVYADQLVFPQGVLWHEGALYSASHPSLWKLEDPERKGIATRRTELVTGFRFNGNGCDIHGPFLGPDGWLYWTDGRHGYKVKTRDGAVLEGLASRIWRCRTDGTDIERLCGGGFDNPVEIAFTPEGEAIGTMDQGPGDCLLHYVEGGVYPMDYPPVMKEFINTGPLLGAAHQYSAVLPAALCGLTSYRSNFYGPDFQDCLFSTHYMVHKIVRHTLVREGSTFRAEDKDFLTTPNHDVRLTDVLEDADGSLLFIDMGAWFTYGFPGNPLPKPEAFGGVYRIRRTGVPPMADPWGKSLNLVSLSPLELVDRLNDPRPKVRDRAIEFLAKCGAKAVPALENSLRGKSGRSVLTRQNALWTLCRISGSAARASVRIALGDTETRVRLTAIYAAGLERDREAMPALCEILKTDVPAARRRAAEALGRMGEAKAVPTLLDGLKRDCDRFLEHAIIYAVIQIHDREKTLAGLTDPHIRVRQGALRALDQMKEGNLTRELVTPLLAISDLDLQQTLLEVISRRPGWSDLAQDIPRKWLQSVSLTADQQRSLTEILLALTEETTIQRVVAETLENPKTPVSTRVFLLELVGKSRVEPLPMLWLSAIDQALAHPDATILREAITVIKMRNLNRFDSKLLALSRQSTLPAVLRIAALECVARRQQSFPAEEFGLLSSHLSDTKEPLVRLAAARTLGAGTLVREQLLQLVTFIPKVSTIVLRLLLPVFAKVPDAEVGFALVEALRHSSSAEALTVAELDKTLQGYSGEVRSRAQAFREKLAARQRGQADYLAQLRADLAPLKGDADAGHELFLSAKVGCFGCHRAVGRGGEVGPDLSKIGQVRSKAELLESIVFPSFTIAPEYRSFQVASKDGRVVTGLVFRDTPEALFLRTTDLAEIRIGRKDIEEIIPSTVSIMPEGLEKTMSRQDLCNLVEFLSRQR